MEPFEDEPNVEWKFVLPMLEDIKDDISRYNGTGPDDAVQDDWVDELINSTEDPTQEEEAGEEEEAD